MAHNARPVSINSIRRRNWLRNQKRRDKPVECKAYPIHDHNPRGPLIMPVTRARKLH